MNITVRLEGVDGLRAALKAAEGRAVPALSAALFTEAESIMADSRKLVPVDLGALKGSGTVAHPSPTMGGVEVEFGYGGAAEDYAVIQHERLDYSHTVGQAKYLEEPVLAHAAGMGARLAVIVRRWLERR